MDAPQLPIPGVSGVVAEQQHLEHSPAEDTTTTVHAAHNNSNNNNGYNSDSRAHYSSRTTPLHEFSAQEAGDLSHRSNLSPSLSTYQPQLPSSSRPSSGLSSGPERYGGFPQQVSQDVAQRPQQQQQQVSLSAKNSVVIKVGMVGDAQIGKTSLMVKYVEGSWDEDYIQTLGECLAKLLSPPPFW